MKNKKILIKLLIVISLIGTIIGSYFYSIKIAPTAFRLSMTTVNDSSLPKEFNNFKIAYFSDLNLSTADDLDRLKNIVTKINSANVQMVIFGGDIFDASSFSKSKIATILKQLNSSYGKFAVLGDKDQSYLEDTKEILSNSGFEVLHNESRLIYYNSSKIVLFGLENTGDVTGLIDTSNKDLFKLAVVHQPDYYQDTKSSINLQLSGHTLGGYINIPFVGSLIKKENGKLYVSGLYSTKTSKLLVSNGVTVEQKYQYRFLTQNEANIITLVR